MGIKNIEELYAELNRIEERLADMFISWAETKRLLIAQAILRNKLNCILKIEKGEH